MKRTKRLLALVLALAMAFSTLLLPAAAHGDEDEGIMPLYESYPCPNCGGDCPVTRGYSDINVDNHAAACNLPNNPLMHTHCTRTFYVRWSCKNCSYSDETSYSVRYCITLDKEIN